MGQDEDKRRMDFMYLVFLSVSICVFMRNFDRDQSHVLFFKMSLAMGLGIWRWTWTICFDRLSTQPTQAPFNFSN